MTKYSDNVGDDGHKRYMYLMVVTVQFNLIIILILKFAEQRSDSRSLESVAKGARSCRRLAYSKHLKCLACNDSPEGEVVDAKWVKKGYVTISRLPGYIFYLGFTQTRLAGSLTSREDDLQQLRKTFILSKSLVHSQCHYLVHELAWLKCTKSALFSNIVTSHFSTYARDKWSSNRDRLGRASSQKL